MSKKEYRDALRDQGRCTECAKFSPGKRVCNECQKKNRDRIAKFNEARRSGKCSRCGQPVVVGLSLCLACKEAARFDPVRAAEKNRARNEAEREEQRRRGLCHQGGCEKPPVAGRPHCQEHLDYFENRRRARYFAGICDSCSSPRTLNPDTQLCEHHLREMREYRLSPKGRFANAKARAKSRSMAWNLTLEQYTYLISLPCEYCGFNIERVGVGLDRRDSAVKSYAWGIVVSCCGVCNTAKSDHFSYEQMKRIGLVLRMERIAAAEIEAWEENARRDEEGKTTLTREILKEDDILWLHEIRNDPLLEHFPIPAEERERAARFERTKEWVPPADFEDEVRKREFAWRS